jgi:hypothetical protein
MMVAQQSPLPPVYPIQHSQRVQRQNSVQTKGSVGEDAKVVRRFEDGQDGYPGEERKVRVKGSDG